jgi:protease PrsW
MTVDHPPAHTGEYQTSTIPPVPAVPYVEAPVSPSAMPAAKVGVQWGRVLLLVAVIGGIAISGIALVLIIGYDLGPTALAVGLGAAILPVPLLVMAFLWLDRFEPEPWKYLAFCFAWGAFVATLIAYLVNTGASILFHRLGWSDTSVATVVAPIIEETSKALGPLLLFIFRRRTFSGVVDAIVYCGLSATGFAMMENILYLGGKAFGQTSDKLGAAAGLQALITLFIVRILMSGFAHPLFTSMTAIGIGVAARNRSTKVRIFAPLGGLILAMMMHSSWNLMSTLVVTFQQPAFILYGYVAFMVPIFFGMVGFALYLRGWEGRLVERTLGDYVRAGWFSPPEAASLRTVSRRLAARQWAKRVAGDTGVTAMKGYQYAATRLALLRDGMKRGLDDNPKDAVRAREEERQLLTDITAFRRVFTGRDPQVPQGTWDGRRYLLSFPDGSIRQIEAPAQPVVPIVVRLLPPPPPPGYAYGGYPPPAYPPGYGPR